MRRPWIKMCGITDPGSGREAALAGADLIGVNFVPESPRAVSFGIAIRISLAFKGAPTGRGKKRARRTVAVFANPDDDLVRSVIEHVKPDILQFHGDESPTFCRSFGVPFLKAFRLAEMEDADAIERYLGGLAAGYLVDAWSPVAFGGTGRLIRIEVAQHALRHAKGFLAGGLKPDNVGDLVRRLRPFGVDVASGIETRPGVKSPDLMAAFVRAVESACREDAAGP
ncbi:MAG: phosphoribosylanthranilate isomerase [Deltaproteobacteria bacterium]|nr:phosphoribosylanthranilate isomerase [Deltaproteobacteria bacterium]MCB9785888.1 phosphoribosylanthranilate isomerase [Deltaproteobacteria bacterium]